MEDSAIISLVAKAICYSSVAQSAEYLTVNQGVTGSSPVWGARKLIRRFLRIFCCMPAGTDYNRINHFSEKKKNSACKNQKSIA